MNNTHEKLLKYLEERNWHKNKPSDLAKSISIESAELLEIFQWKNYSSAELKKDTLKLKSLQDEVADIYIYLFGLSTSIGFDLDKAVETKLEKVIKKYPVDVLNKDRNSYYRIKKEYRKNA